MQTVQVPPASQTAQREASEAVGAEIYTELGITPVINARGNQTVLGGALLSPRILAAMDEANRYFVDMDALLTRTGQMAAELVQCEAAYVTPGCAAALALGTAACITGGDGAKIERLPDTTGMRNQLLIQARHRYKYDRPPTIVGAKLREAGAAAGTTARQLEAAIGPETAVVLFPAHLDGQEGTVRLPEVLEIAHARGVPVLVDAAAQIYPVERMRGWTKMGADLVCFGAKYFGAPHSSGLLCGRKDLVESAAQQGFIGFERGQYRTFGRPLKLDRGEIVAVALALREWVTMDHAARIARVQERVNAVIERLAGIPLITATSMSEAHFGAPALRVQIAPSNGRSAETVAAALRAGSPSIVASQSGDSIRFNLTTVYDGDELVIAERLRAALTS
ncbi:MAG: aminotransferase class V-fold PLP-dependent enzyme [Chloroflexi bacterium]|nr:aminotransferase class V-fold PLP-dependent enzyme [Chloroflexota bacterium]